GTHLEPDWSTEKEAIILLAPFGVLANQLNLKGEEDSDGNIITDDMPFKQNYKSRLLEYIEKNYHYWEEYRNDLMSIQDEQESCQRISHKIGRNDPCPCGSGKKYKK